MLDIGSVEAFLPADSNREEPKRKACRMPLSYPMMLAISSLALGASLVGYEHQAVPRSGVHEKSDYDSGAIVVTGKRDDLSEVPGVITGSGRTRTQDGGDGPIDVAFTYSYARDVARCAMNDDIRQIKIAVDGAPSSPSQVYAQDWIVRNNITCSVSGNLLSIAPPELGRSMYQRGALITEVLVRFAPNLILSRSQTTDPAVIKRYEAREAKRNRVRAPSDLRYFRAVTCMVQLQPEASVKLAYGNFGSKEESKIREKILGGAQFCLGNPRNVYVKALQFRVYVADAVYRWAVAVQNVDTLIKS
ncbi:hypothetical protein KCP91_15570 [Microvirga sp. SRT01]|uniref:Uncharacterized protein n=1 Tax=Sphingomonas longa TaxID=2778730 RepID=A0ABS2DA48_9SPHN|nr:MULTISPECIES: hypothetical protein [Alphaproteobacteria]MBM6577802.1 hypothetical protein [Sphingomonas sp. BT552]MBR7710844.1 hypothetical protein [Microvirga sp. SRT01]